MYLYIYTYGCAICPANKNISKYLPGCFPLVDSQLQGTPIAIRRKSRPLSEFSRSKTRGGSQSKTTKKIGGTLEHRFFHSEHMIFGWKQGNTSALTRSRGCKYCLEPTKNALRWPRHVACCLRNSSSNLHCCLFCKCGHLFLPLPCQHLPHCPTKKKGKLTQRCDPNVFSSQTPTGSDFIWVWYLIQEKRHWSSWIIIFIHFRTQPIDLLHPHCLFRLDHESLNLPIHDDH